MLRRWLFTLSNTRISLVCLVKELLKKHQNSWKLTQQFFGPTVSHGDKIFDTVWHGVKIFKTVLHGVIETVSHGDKNFDTVLHGVKIFNTVLHGVIETVSHDDKIFDIMSKCYHRITRFQ